MRKHAEIFISYRRFDTASVATALRRDLQSFYGQSAVFLDDSIRTGDNIRQAVEEAIENAVLVLLLIGPLWRWDEMGEDSDWLRFEVRTALTHGKKILPVTVGDASMPKSGSLPSDISELADIKAVPLLPGELKGEIDGVGVLGRRPGSELAFRLPNAMEAMEAISTDLRQLRISEQANRVLRAERTQRLARERQARSELSFAQFQADAIASVEADERRQEWRRLSLVRERAAIERMHKVRERRDVPVHQEESARARQFRVGIAAVRETAASSNLERVRAIRRIENANVRPHKCQSCSNNLLWPKRLELTARLECSSCQARYELVPVPSLLRLLSRRSLRWRQL